jgi:tRNA pseudouridine55 synthase
MNFIEGEVIIINKDIDWTSFDVVNKIRYIIKAKLNIKKIKVGHAGTLDPKATGVVVVCTGKKTKEIDTFQNEQKEYIAEIKLGETTPSFDIETEPDNFFETNNLKEREIIEAIKSFKGLQQQIPPIYSAIHINGKRAYEIARQGKTVEITPREIEIFDIQILELKIPIIKIKIKCSKGTYIRALARDIGLKLNNGAHLISLIRTASGNYKIEDAIKISEFEHLINTLNT